MKDDSLVEMDESTSLSIASQLANLFEENSNLNDPEDNDDLDENEDDSGESIVPRVSLENHGVADSSQKPDITHLDDAIVGGTLLVKVGEKLVLERCASLVDKRYWLDTAVYKILTLDDDGMMRLLCMETGRRVFDNWKEGPTKYSYIYKIPPKKGSFYKQRTKKPKPAPTMGAKKIVVQEIQAPVAASPEKKQGRRKGIPNRPKHVRVAEQKAKAEERLARKKALQDKKKARNVAKALSKAPATKEKVSAGPGRGRPKGTKNRSKEERAKAKAELDAQRKAKKAIREQKRAMKNGTVRSS